MGWCYYSEWQLFTQCLHLLRQICHLAGLGVLARVIAGILAPEVDRVGSKVYGGGVALTSSSSIGLLSGPGFCSPISGVETTKNEDDKDESRYTIL